MRAYWANICRLRGPPPVFFVRSRSRSWPSTTRAPRVEVSIPMLMQDSAAQELRTCVLALQILAPRSSLGLGLCGGRVGRVGARLALRDATRDAEILGTAARRSCTRTRDDELRCAFARLCETLLALRVACCCESLPPLLSLLSLRHSLCRSPVAGQPVSRAPCTRGSSRPCTSAFAAFWLGDTACTHARTGRRATRCLHATRVSAAICQLSTRTVRDPPTLGDGRRAGTRRLWNIGTARYGVVRARPPPSSPAQPCPRPP